MHAITIKDDAKYLRQKSKKVNFKNKDYLEDVKKLEEYCLNHDVFAMAAIQIGIPKRIIYLKNTDLDKVEDKDWNEAQVLINPIIKKRVGLTTFWEACASCLDNMGLVKRPYEIELEYYDINGNLNTKIFKDFESTVLSHEYDHLDGILHIDIADKIMIMKADDRKEFRKKEPYNIIYKEGDYEVLKNE